MREIASVQKKNPPPRSRCAQKRSRMSSSLIEAGVDDWLDSAALWLQRVCSPPPTHAHHRPSWEVKKKYFFFLACCGRMSTMPSLTTVGWMAQHSARGVGISQRTKDETKKERGLVNNSHSRDGSANRNDSNPHTLLHVPHAHNPVDQSSFLHKPLKLKCTCDCTARSHGVREMAIMAELSRSSPKSSLARITSKPQYG
ncbi:hypothetical protein EX30DRAFT_195757 [Ascodesmis nigricans]|uniref:Uncharacterized protein n=1 Tax=Ascodesmis nigricans TaxID=341454 RepID=A0A4S2MRK4_9PEZI|nr:hypothetical protein EX30DRAFT_195757 [Ascodesmis nigricans]